LRLGAQRKPIEPIKPIKLIKPIKKLSAFRVCPVKNYCSFPLYRGFFQKIPFFLSEKLCFNLIKSKNEVSFHDNQKITGV